MPCSTCTDEARCDQLGLCQDAAREQLQRNPNQGHGHVNPSPDGMRARCGGPGICRVCAVEAGQLPGRKPQ